MKTTPVCSYLLVLVLAAFTITACSGGGSNSAQQIAALPAEKYVVSGSITDPAGTPVSGTVTLTATDAAGAAVKLYSDKTGGTELTSVAVDAQGALSFFVAGSAAVPVTVKAVAVSPGLLSSSVTLTIDKAGSSSFTIKLVDTKNNSVAGVFSGATTGALNTGLTITATPNPLDPASVTKTAGQVILAPNTALTDSTGAALSGPVTATVSTFAPPIGYGVDPVADEALLSGALGVENFPGSLDHAMVAAGNGYFVTAGFVAVDIIDASGKKAKHSDTPFTIHLDIPPGTINPLTDAPLAVGDFIPVWTYSDTDSNWVEERGTNGVQVLEPVKQGAKGLFVEHTTNHFSFWNLGWFFVNHCTATLNLTGDAVLLPLTLKATFSNGAGFLLNGFKPSGDATVTAINVPSGKNLDLVLLDSNNNVVASKKKFNWCAGPITLGYTAPPALKPVPVTVKVIEYCVQNPAVTRPVPSVSTFVTKSLLPISTGTTDLNGSFVHNLIAGTYSIYAFNRTTFVFNAQTNVNVVAATPQTITFKRPVTCRPISGSTGGYGF